MPPRARVAGACWDVRPCLLTQYATVEARGRSRARSTRSSGLRRAALRASARSMTTRTLVRVSDGKGLLRSAGGGSRRARAGARRRARATPLVPPDSGRWRCGARGGAGRAAAPRARASPAWPRARPARITSSATSRASASSPAGRLAAGRAQAAAQVRGGLAGRGRGEVVLEVDLGEPRLALVGQREAVREERALALLAAGERGARVDGLRRRHGRNRSRPPPAPRRSMAPAAAPGALSHGRPPRRPSPSSRRGRRAPRRPAGAAQHLVDQLLAQPEPVRDELHELGAQHARPASERSSAPRRRASRRCWRRSARARARPRSARPAPRSSSSCAHRLDARTLHDVRRVLLGREADDPELDLARRATSPSSSACDSASRPRLRPTPGPRCRGPGRAALSAPAARSRRPAAPSAPCPSARRPRARRPGAARSRRCSPRPARPARPWRPPRAPGPRRRRSGPCGRPRRRTC